MLTEAQHDLDFFSMQCELPNGAKPDGSSLKMSPDSSAAMLEATLLPWLEKWLGASLTYRQTAGEILALLPARSDSSSGLLWMRNSSEFNHIPAQSPNDVDVCSLSDILETGEVPRRYFLSAKACAGILRRAEKRGKKLPQQLELALQTVARGTGPEAETVKTS